MKNFSLLAILAAFFMGSPIATAADGAPANSVDILNMTSFWRWSVTYCKPMILATDGAPAKLLKHDAIDALTGPAAPADWMEASFDDSTWPRARATELALAPFDQFSSAVVYLRGRFAVGDLAAAGPMTLTLKYIGGAVVYLNGKEIWRGNLPAGPLTGDSRADPYPDEVYVDVDRQPIPNAHHLATRPADQRADLEVRVAKRLRSADAVPLPPQALVKGVNVLAIALHRSDYNPITAKAWLSQSHVGGVLFIRSWFWNHVNLLALQLQAAPGSAVANVVRPPGPRLWVQDVQERVLNDDYGDPNDPPPAIRLYGARNGSFSGQVVVGSPTELDTIRAVCSDLKAAKDAGAIPAANVTILYGAHMEQHGGIKSRWFDGLTAAAPDKVPVGTDGANMPIFFRVRVPRDAAPGDYSGHLTVSAAGMAPVDVPVALNVADWAIPDPKDYRTFVAIYQSPTTVAMQYKVKEWSQEHWQLMEKSFALLGRAGNKLVNVTVAEHTQFGNDEGMIYWIKSPGGGYDYDFTVFDRYLAMAKKYCGTLDHVALQVWHCGGWESRKADQENTMTLVDPTTGKHESLQVPTFGTEESKQFYKPFLEACRAHLAKIGLENAMCVGTLSDGTASKDVFKAFDDIWPGGGPSKWTRGLHSVDHHPSPYELLKGGAQVVLHEFCYGFYLADPEKPLPAICNQRSMPGTSFRRIGGQELAPLLWYKVFPEQALFCNTKGIGRTCLDYWPVLKGSGENTLYNRYPFSSCAQRAPTLMSMTWPGPTGAETTIRFEMLCQGIQDADADIVISDAITNHADAIGHELAERGRQLLVERLYYMHSRDQSSYQRFLPRCNHTGWADLDRRTYQCAADVVGKLAKAK